MRPVVYHRVMIDITTEDGAVLLPVKIVPGASRTRFLGEWDHRAKIAVSAPPEKGKANKAVIEFIAKKLGARKSDVTVVAGFTSAVKKIRIDRVEADKVISAFST